ncbi:MAG: response regulator transcription factor [Cytophagales bacterium]|nr:response regulator transcription factor [Cytophagales bacterium]
MSKIQLAIVDDHEMVRKAFRRLLNLENDLEVMLEAENGIDLLQKLPKSNPEIILMDIRMPKMNGIEATDKVLSQYQNIKIIAFTQFDDEQNIIEMYSRGAKAFLCKQCEPEELFKVIRIVHKGGAYLTDQNLKIIQSQLKPRSTQSQESSCFIFELTAQEMKIIQLLQAGKTSKEIASTLKLTIKTIRTYRERLLKKTKTRNVVELLNACREENSNIKPL